MNATWRALGLAALAIGAWFLCRALLEPQTIRPADAPATEFSAARADKLLARILGPENPHPASSPENNALRARIIDEFAKLGMVVRPLRASGCNYAERYGAIQCATVTNILAEIRGGEGKAVLLLAHYDSVPAGPGAADDGSGVAAILETARALKARGLPGKHPIFALITDGEEYGLLGAAAFLRDPQWKAKIGAVVNVEARGNRGPSLLFQTSKGDAALIDLYAKNAPRPVTSSLFSEIYERLPNDTDLTLFIHANIPSFNFAFLGNVAHYHTPLDRRENLSLASLQHHGDNLLATALGLAQSDFTALKSSDAIYLSLFGFAVPRLPEAFALPLSLALFAILFFAGLHAAPRKQRWDQHLRAFALPPLLLIGCIASGFALHAIAQLVSGNPDPSFAFPLALRLGFALAICGTALLVLPIVESPSLAARAVWLWLAALGVLSAAFLPGLSPYFLIPCTIAAVLLLATSRLRQGWRGPTGQIALLIAALINLLIWFDLLVLGESLMGLQLHPLFTLPAALGILALIPLAEGKPRRYGLALGASFTLSLCAAITAGLLPSHSKAAPQSINLNYVEDHTKDRALWTADSAAPLPEALRNAAKFSEEREQIVPIGFQKSYAAPAGKPRLTPPKAEAVIEGRKVKLTLQGKEGQLFLVIPKEAELKAVSIRGSHIRIKPSLTGKTIIGCLTSDCQSLTLTLDIAAKKPFDILTGTRRFGLPPEGEKLRKARPDTAVPSRLGDGTILISKLRVTP